MKRTFIFMVALAALFAMSSCDSKNNTTSIHGIANIEEATPYDEWAYDEDSYGGDEVYVCTGGSSKKYHSSPDCRYLDNCKGEVREVDQLFAEEKGRTACKACYRE